MLRSTVICFLMVLTPCTLCNSTDPGRDAYCEVKAMLLAHPYAVNKIPPKVGFYDSVSVRIKFTPHQILYVNEAEMTVTVGATLALEWDDPAFAWDPALKDNITTVSVSREDIWTPVIINTKTINTDNIYIEMPQTLLVDFLGTIRTVQMLTITASCSFDMEWYPFDEQICSFEFVPFNGESASINTVALDGVGPMDNTDTSRFDKSEWSYGDVKATHVYASIGRESTAAKSLIYTNFQVSMKRESTYFYMTNVIFPVAATAVLVVGVFLIPPSSGEKISYLVSIFISMTVFLSSVSSGMAKSEGNICRLNVLIVVITGEIILATAASIFVLRRYTQEQEEKEEEVTSLAPVRGKGDNSYLNVENLLAEQRLGRDLNGSLIGEDENDSTVPRESDATGTRISVKRDAFERSLSTTADLPKSSGTSRFKRQMSGIRRYLKKGERFTSAELDRLFFIIFFVASPFLHIFVMRANS